MFGIDSGELLVVALIALLVIGPKDLPRAMRAIGQFVGRARGMARHFRAGFDTMIREAELEEMEKKWKEENERIMRAHPPAPAAEPDWGAAEEANAPPTPLPPPPEPASGRSKPKAPPAAGEAAAPARSAPPAPPARPSGDLP